MSRSPVSASLLLSHRLADRGAVPARPLAQQHSHPLHHRLLSPLPLTPDSPKLKKIEVGNKCLKSLDTFRISGLPLLTSLFIGDESFDDECARARIGGGTGRE